MQKELGIASLIGKAIEILQELQDLNEPATVSESGPPLGNDIISVIWVSCGGLSKLAQEFGVSRVDKISTTTERDLSSRLAILGRDQYGAVIRNANGRMQTQPGFRKWIAQAIHTTGLP